MIETGLEQKFSNNNWEIKFPALVKSSLFAAKTSLTWSQAEAASVISVEAEQRQLLYPLMFYFNKWIAASAKLGVRRVLLCLFWCGFLFHFGFGFFVCFWLLGGCFLFVFISLNWYFLCSQSMEMAVPSRSRWCLVWSQRWTSSPSSAETRSSRACWLHPTLLLWQGQACRPKPETPGWGCLLVSCSWLFLKMTRWKL